MVGSWTVVAVALAGVLGMLVLLARLARASGLATATRTGRLRVIEILPLDGRRRLVLLRCDGREVLVVLGGAQDSVIGWLPPGPDASTDTVMR